MKEATKKLYLIEEMGGTLVVICQAVDNTPTKILHEVGASTMGTDVVDAFESMEDYCWELWESKLISINGLKF